MNFNTFESRVRCFTLAALVVASSVTPAAASAQSAQSLTREEVKAELVKLENAGYQPAQNDPYYPRKLQAAEAKLATQGREGLSAFGSESTTRAQSGTAGRKSAGHSGAKSLYSGH